LLSKINSKALHGAEESETYHSVNAATHVTFLTKKWLAYKRSNLAISTADCSTYLRKTVSCTKLLYPTEYKTYTTIISY
jgi:hypothetical protein